MTGPANRRRFDAALHAAAGGAIAGRPCAVLYLDLDRFAQINDAVGRDGGDALLRDVGSRLDATVRALDVVARLGDDEFAVLMPRIDSRAGLTDAPLALARRIQAALAEPFVVGTHTVSLQTSVGIAHAPLHGLEPASLLRAAHQALFAAKRAGRNAIGLPSGVVEHGSARIDADVDTRALQDALSEAIATDQLSLHWQPYVCAADGAVAGYEALLRWPQPNGDSISPEFVVPLAEVSGAIVTLDTWVLHRACAAAAAWPAPNGVSVNLSAYWFSRGDAVTLVREALRQSGLPPQRLRVELTERTVIDHAADAQAAIAGLHALGVEVALDDFGVGYSSLSHVLAYQFDVLKLDRRFVDGIGRERKAEAVARAIIRLGKDLGMKLCAEGVTTAAQADFLRAESCDLLQGYWVGRPLKDVTSALPMPSA